MIQTLNLRFEKLKILSDNLTEYFSLLFVCINEILGNFLDIFDGVTRMHFLVIRMMFDASFGLADGTCTCTSDTASHQYCFQGMQTTE